MSRFWMPAVMCFTCVLFLLATGEKPVNCAELKLSPQIGSYRIGDTFNVDILMDTRGQNVVAVSAYIKYDPVCFRANSVDTSNSVLTMVAEKIIDSNNGLIKITNGRITPGVNTINGKVASINFTAVSPTIPKSDNFTFALVESPFGKSDVCKDDGLGTGILRKVYNGRFAVLGTISLQSPVDQSLFNPCSLISKYQPTFNWTNSGTFENSTILFSTTAIDFKTPIVRVPIPGSQNSWTPPIWSWRKIMNSSNNNGNFREVYWKVLGTNRSWPGVESNVRILRIGDSQAVTIDAPVNGAVLPADVEPTFDFNSNCNIKFLLQFSSVSDFSGPKKIKGFVFTTTDPNIETTLNPKLSSLQWNNVKKLVGSGTGYFRIKAWDGINRETISEVRSFTIQ